MSKIHLVGCGALGSVIALEAIKRARSVGSTIEVHLYDSDTVQDRNVAAQNFSPKHIGKPKVEAVREQLADYDIAEVVAHCVRLESDNLMREMKLEKGDVVIDAVDNIPTRQLLWTIGTSGLVPVMHVGMAQSGSGNISWNFKDFDTFPLSPKYSTTAHSEAVRKPEEEADRELAVESLPPCELSARRSLILNTAMAAVNSLFIYRGQDITAEMEELTKGEIHMQLVTCWESNMYGHSCVKRRDTITYFEE